MNVYVRARVLQTNKPTYIHACMHASIPRYTIMHALHAYICNPNRLHIIIHVCIYVYVRVST